jgi:hypothetical protein
MQRADQRSKFDLADELNLVQQEDNPRALAGGSPAQLQEELGEITGDRPLVGPCSILRSRE